MRRYQVCILFLLAIVIHSCNKNIPSPNTMASATPQPDSQNEYTYLALGDSYTIGESVPEADQWGMQLADLLRASGLQISKPVTVARTGWTTAELAQAITAKQITQTFDLVSLLIGVNNQYRGQPLETYQTEFAALLDTAIRFAKNKPAHVMVLSIPDWGQTPFARGRDTHRITQEIAAFNASAEAICRQAGVSFVNITPLTQQIATNPGYLASDGLHYSGQMHRQWAQLALPIAQKILK